MQKSLLEKARAFREANTHTVSDYTEFQKQLDAKGGFYVAPWCQSKDCEAKVKEETKATIRCLPLDAKYELIPESGACLACSSTQSPRVRAVWARSY
jgi:prolyl-tRNA synthetase